MFCTTAAPLWHITKHFISNSRFKKTKQTENHHIPSAIWYIV